MKDEESGTQADHSGSSSSFILHPSSFKHYQITHDYLVHSLREWLTRKQRETRRGRAELRLAERAAIWDDKPENRHLPSLAEWVSIRSLSRRKDWTDPERRMMRRAGRVHGLRAIGFAALGAVVAAMGLNAWNRLSEANQAKDKAADSLVQQLLKGDIGEVSETVASNDYNRLRARPELRRALDAPWVDPKAKLNASLALLPEDPAQVAYLEMRLLDAKPHELTVVRQALHKKKDDLVPKLWKIADEAKADDPRLLTSAGALALYDPENGRWSGVVDKVAQTLVRVSPDILDSWLAVLRPLSGKLAEPLAVIFRDKDRPAAEHVLITRAIADYAAGAPGLLADLLMDASPTAFNSLFPLAQREVDKTLPVLHAELLKQTEPLWKDLPIAPAWTTPEPAIADCIVSAQGLLEGRFAFCQTMPLADFRDVTRVLEKSGYRPIRLRPYPDGNTVNVAAVWTRDGRASRLSLDKSGTAILQEDERNRNDAFIPVDVAGYTWTDGPGKTTDRYAALWVHRAETDVGARLYVGHTAEDEIEFQNQLKDDELNLRTSQAMLGSDGHVRYCGVWGPAVADGVAAHGERNLFETDFMATVERRRDLVVIDVAASEANLPQTTDERMRAVRSIAERTLQSKPGNLNAKRQRAIANLRLGETATALEDLSALIATDRADVEVLPYRTIAQARLNHKNEARADLERFQRAYTPAHAKLFLAAVVAAELNEGTAERFKDLEQAVEKRPQDSDLRYEAARALALASKAVGRRDPAEGRRFVDRALQSLKLLVQDHEADFGRMDDDQALDPIRDEPAFVDVIRAGHPERRYAAVWTGDPRFESKVVECNDPAEQLRRSRELRDEQYRPVAWSVARIARNGSLATASVWHRPVVSEEEKDQRAARQARAAVALLRLRRPEAVWSLLQLKDDPRLRSFIINWLSPLGADPNVIATEFNRADSSARPAVIPGPERMKDVLLDRQTSIRRAMIQALGTFTAAELPAAVRDALTTTLLKVYRDDADAGIHGAAEWTLRQWKQHEKLKSSDDELKGLTKWGDRRWYVNGQGQTLAVIDGPVDFLMGSPGSEPDHNPEREPRRRITIPRRFAIATKEVTVKQFQRFLTTNDQFKLRQSDLKLYSPSPDGPWIGPDWYGAAAYCNWLSEQEGLTRDQYCYLPNETGVCGEGMIIPSDVLERTGYRLPTEAEWEYACRAGTVTSRYHGVSTKLLEKYARYQPNSAEHAWEAGSLLPNDFGLFDMLGNVFEWCQDADGTFRSLNKGLYIDHVLVNETLINKNQRVLRGGAFYVQSAEVRSAAHYSDVPSLRNANDGFRVAKTLH